MLPALWMLGAYLLGAVPAGYLAGRLRGVDLRNHGSRNLGATNTFRVLGPRVAVPVLLFDALKGFVPTALFPLWDGTDAWGWALAYGAAALVGHMFSVYVRFKGGKGVATGAGVFLALSPLAVGLAFVSFALTVAAWRMVSLGSMVAALVLAVVLAVTDPRPAVALLGALVAALVVIRHRANIGRILRGEESRMGGPVAERKTTERGSR